MKRYGFSSMAPMPARRADAPFGTANPHDGEIRVRIGDMTGEARKDKRPAFALKYPAGT